MDERERKIGLNEALFRKLNERMEELNVAFATLTDDMQIVCECGDGGCTQPIRMSVGEYERLRGNPTHFAVARGHLIPDVEDVVERQTGYEVVEKRPGAPAELAQRTDPRSEQR